MQCRTVDAEMPASTNILNLTEKNKSMPCLARVGINKGLAPRRYMGLPQGASLCILLIKLLCADMYSKQTERVTARRELKNAFVFRRYEPSLFLGKTGRKQGS